MQTSKYEVLGIVGEGAYGIVYKCRNKETNEFVAIKKFKETEDDIVKKSMLRELKVLKILKHENIVEFKEAFKRKGNLYLVFEYVEKTLLELLQQKSKGLDPELIKKIIFQLCKAIKHLHDLNIIHRDIKPENLLMDKNNKLKLCDFGFARSINNNKNKEQLTDYVATRWYRSPELLLGNGYYGPEMDYWAIGCIMGELADGDPLFPGEDEIDQIVCIMKILGKLTDEQVNAYNKTQRFSGNKLPDIARPETLEKRYAGKLNKIAINFMKMLLHPDPNLRLKGDLVFLHPYFENFKIEANEIISNKNVVNAFSNIQVENSARNEKDFNENEKKSKKVTNNINYNSNNNLLTMPNINEVISTSNKESIKSFNNQQPIISNTTNINIINYNYDNDSKRSNNELKKSDNESNYKKNSMVLTTLNFPKNYKENLINMYGGTNFDNNYKTFYKNDKYNYEIDLNFKNQKKGKLLSIDEEEENEGKKKSKSYPKQLKPNINKLKNIEIGGENDYKPGMKSKKNVEKIYQKNSPNKYPNYNNNTKNNALNLNGLASNFNYNLPNITMKNFKLKK